MQISHVLPEKYEMTRSVKFTTKVLGYLLFRVLPALCFLGEALEH